MKLQIVSDLHMEFAPIEITNAGADLLILSGDICVAEYFARSKDSPLRSTAHVWLEWFERTCARFPRVIYVLGNHEHYKGRFYETYDVLWNALKHIENLHILDCRLHLLNLATIEIEDVTFVGGTLWTDFDRSDFKAATVQNGLNDFRLIEGRDYRKLKPAETVIYHDTMKSRIESVCNHSDKVVVVGHHAPSCRSISSEYVSGPYANLNPGYASRLDDFIREHPQVVLWTHGHVHSSHDYQIGSTRIVANPRGYDQGSGPENKQFNPNLIVEI